MSTDTELEIQRTLGSLESKLDGLVKMMEDQNATTVKRLDNHGTRLGALERWRTGIVGGFAVITTIGGLVWKSILERGH